MTFSSQGLPDARRGSAAVQGKVTGITANSLRLLRCSPHPRVNPHSIPTILSSFLAVAAASFSLT